MSEENEQFEQRLKRRSLKQVPAEWRDEILSAAIKAESLRHSAKSGVPAAALQDASDAGKFTFLQRLSSWLWPHPVAWGGLAAVWVLIFTVHFSIRDDAPVLAEKVVPQSPEVIAQLQQQHRLLAELLGPNDSLDADRPKIFVPKPRSESVEILSA
jgi:hypothetical protein